MEINELISGVVVKEIDKALSERSNVAPRIFSLKAPLLERKDPTDPSFALLDFTGNTPAEPLSNQ
jgi:hypothetical protein